MVGNVAVPTMLSRNGGPCPVLATTVSPTCLCNWAKVTGPSTTCDADCRPCPDSSGGLTGAFRLLANAGTCCPSISICSKYTPVQ
jgi:hypothetical protein